MKRKIFICDDDRNIVEMLEMVLQEFTDATILTETDSREALPRLLQERPDVLIVDLAMPIVSGDQLIKEVRNALTINQMFIVCMSANPIGEQIANSAGADIYLAKPFDMGEFLAVIRGKAKTG